MGQGAPWEPSFYDAILKVHYHLMTAIFGVKVGRVMLPIIHRNDNAEESAYLRHRGLRVSW